jgi:outer membrane protein assembly factor BamB
MQRRTFLALSGLSLAAGLGGCVSEGPAGSTGDGDPQPASEPRQFQTDASNTGATGGEVPGSATVDWQTTIPPVDGGLSVGDSRLVVAGHGDLTALDTEDGSELWSVDVGLDTGLAPAIADDTAYVTAWNGGQNHDRGVVAIALDGGDERWRAVPNVGVSSAPTLAGDSLYVGGSVNSNEVIAIGAAEGRERWRFEAARHATTPAVADGTVYAGGGKEKVVYAIDADTGEELWRFETEGEAMNPPTVADGTVYVPDRSGHLYALNPGDGSEQWSVQVGSTGGGSMSAGDESDRSRRSTGDEPQIWGSVAVTNDSVYVPADDSVVALDSDGSRRWTIGRGAVHPPVVAGDSLLITTSQRAFCLDTADGAERWHYEVEDRAMGDAVYAGINCGLAVGDGVAFVAAHGGHVYALV